MDRFCVELDIFRGPVDLLYYLVRQEELAITEISLARVVDQYLKYLSVLQELDVDEVAEFMELAAQLLEWKAQYVLPQEEAAAHVADEGGQHELVQRLIEYKQYRDAATVLEERSRAWQLRYPRLVPQLSPSCVDLSAQPLQEVELWDLVSAFGRIIRDNRAVQPSSMVYDETPIDVYMERIVERLRGQGRVAFSELFLPGMHKSAMIGMFLALLELVRHHRVKTEQHELHGEIWLYFDETPDACVDETQIEAEDATSDQVTP